MRLWVVKCSLLNSRPYFWLLGMRSQRGGNIPKSQKAQEWQSRAVAETQAQE